jgi:predicted nucleotide-binding protein
VHGHDGASKQAVARCLEQLKLEPVILHEHPNARRTVIEKFEAYSDVRFAVVLLTPDDVAGRQRRARQNVILELGFFLGKLGRKGVCPLYQQGVELPSDIAGVVYVALDEHGAWRLKLAQELKAAGIEIDLNDLG